MAPQVGAGFNRGIWRTLENDVRKWTESRGELYVVSGPIYEGNNIKTIGPDHVAVPTAFYKVIFDPVQVETKTGLNFLSKLNDDIENLVETKKQKSIW